MNRRSILKTSLFTAASTALFGKPISFRKEETLSSLALSENEITYFVKSGHPKNDNTFAYAVFKINEHNSVSNDVNEIFEANKYRTELKYSSNDKYKLEVSKQLMDYSFKSQNISIEIHVFASNNASFIDLKPSDYKEKMDSVLSNIDFKKLFGSSIKMKKEDNFGPSRSDASKFLSSTGKSIDAFVASEDRVMQFCDLISGTAFATLTNKVIEASVKKELIKYFKEISRIESKLSNQDAKNIKIYVHKIK